MIEQDDHSAPLILLIVGLLFGAVAGCVGAAGLGWLGRTQGWW